MHSLARYRPLRRVGSGAAGGVYLVEDRVLGGDPVALKRLEQAGDRALRDSYAREFAVLASLSLEGVARVHDLGVMPAAGEIPAGPFFTREFVDGEPLSRWAEARAHRMEALLPVLLRVLSIVRALHARGVVHGDLKPDNVIVREDGRPVLIDFGLASRGEALTESGSPLSMAPELFSGAQCSMRTDVYALGALLWAAVTGRAPLAELGPRALGEKLRGVLPRIAVSEPRASALLEAALWALAPDATDRAPSVDALAARIERATAVRAELAASSSASAPRPRGREALLDDLTQWAGAHGRGLRVAHGARGMGKSTLLRELKWRLQLAGTPLLELRCGDAESAPVSQLVRQLSLLRPGLVELKRAMAHGAPRGTLVAEVVAALKSEGAPRLLLIDDLEHGGTLLAEILRGALVDDVSGPPLAVLATSDELSHPALSGFVDLDAVALDPLGDATARAIIDDVVGPLDEPLVAGLVARAAGNPGVLAEALAWLAARGDRAAHDVAELGTGDIAARLAEARVRGLSDAALALLVLLAAARAPLPASLIDALFGPDTARARAALRERGLARAEGARLLASDHAVSAWLRAERAEEARGVARRALRCEASGALDPVARLELALVVAEPSGLEGAVMPALESLGVRGELATALRLCEACLAIGCDEPALLLAASELAAELGASATAAEHAECMLTRGGVDEQLAARGRLAAARAHVASGNLDRAVVLLSSVPSEAPPALRADALRELSRLLLRRGDLAGVRDAVGAGLALAAPDDPVRAELLSLEATLAGHAGDHARARAGFEAALELARGSGHPRDEARVLGYRALSEERRGELAAARADYEAGLAAARAAGDLGLTATYALNLGNVSFRAGHLEGIAQHYTLAARLSRRAGRLSTALLAENNQAHLELYLGNFERARVLAESSRAEAERHGIEVASAQALHVLADVDGRTGALEAALAHYEAAAGRFQRLGRTHELTEIWLDVAEHLLDRGGVSDVSASSARLASARTLIERHGHEDLRPRLRLLIARARAGNGDLEGARGELAELATLLERTGDREQLFRVVLAEAELHAQLGLGHLAAAAAQRAALIVEQLAARVPRDAREAFFADPRRRAARMRAEASRSAGAPQGGAMTHEPRITRLLELIKRLARERDLDRLLERITDAAVDLSGAERGFVLLADARGQLSPHTVRTSFAADSDPHVAFSRSIAEAVLIDGEPIVTVNARDDRRLSEYVSVHKLMLKSVACVPISGPLGVVGVLYLEHRLRAGRFQESDVDLLVAFADQAAIAIENARLWSENERRQRELALKAEELAAAKQEIERVLAARTEELEEVRRDLGRARAALGVQASRHGIIGRSPAMQRVFALIERVADSPVPVVIEGESGTGKELVARAIHFSGARAKGPFVAVNCAALPTSLLESELFGHVRGAFTGADRDKRGLFGEAEGGTIFLDEFADMSLRMQIGLLRVLQERRIRAVGADADVPIDVRVIAATNRPLKQLLASGSLREDLYYRMSVVEIRLPPLRERDEDIPLLCDHFLSRMVSREGARPRRLSRAALERIVASGLPGNVRQLEHLLTSAAMLAEGAQIEPGDLALDGEVEAEHARAAPTSSRPPDAPSDLSGHKSREKQRILAALEENGWNRAKAAQALGMPRRTFYRRLSEFNIL